MTKFAALLVLSAASSCAIASQTCQELHTDATSGTVSILGNDFPAIQAVADAAASCQSDTLHISSNLTSNNKTLQVPALQADPARYTTSIVGNAALVPLLNQNLLQPLDNYVAKYGSSLSPQQLVTIDGKIMAIAFMANAQHLFYREDLLQQAELEVPVSYAELLHAAKTIREKKIRQYPIAGTYQAGWNLGLEFINLYMATGAMFFEKGTARADINNEHGVAALQMMKSLSDYMQPGFLTHDANAVQKEWESGNAALANFWGSRAAAVLDNTTSDEQSRAYTRFSGAPVFGDNAAQASTLWWIGFTLAKHISAKDAEATFRVMLQATSGAVVKAHNDKAVWLDPAYKATPDSQGVAKVIAAATPPYPMQPQMNLLHTALGSEIVDFLKGTETAQQTLNDIEAAYHDAATEAGFLH